MMSICPDCNEDLKPGARRCKCGWQAAPSPGMPTKTGGYDPDWWRCADELLGQRCSKAGSISHGTHGGGPWYCQAHFYRQRPGAEEREIAPGYLRKIRDLLTPIPPDREADEERRAIQGEP